MALVIKTVGFGDGGTQALVFLGFTLVFQLYSATGAGFFALAELIGWGWDDGCALPVWVGAWAGAVGAEVATADKTAVGEFAVDGDFIVAFAAQVDGFAGVVDLIDAGAFSAARKGFAGELAGVLWLFAVAELVDAIIEFGVVAQALLGGGDVGWNQVGVGETAKQQDKGKVEGAHGCPC